MTKIFDSILGKRSPRKRETEEDLQKRLDELSILNKLSVALSSGQDLYHLLGLLLDELKKLFTVDIFYIGIFDSKASLVNFPVFYEKGEFRYIEGRNLHEKPGFTGTVIFAEKTLYIPDRAKPEVQQKYHPLTISQTQSRSYLGTPLMLNNTVIGILSVQSEQPDAYTQQQIQLLETIAAQSAVAIEKARLFFELQNELAEHKQSEEALRKSEARYRAVIENQTEFIVRWKPDGTRTFVNDAYCHYFNISPELALSTSFMPLIVDGDRPFMEERISRLLSGTTETESYTLRVTKPDGSIGWQEWVDHTIRDENGQLVEVQSVGRDVTERKKIEQELQETNERFHQMADNIQEVFWIGDPVTNENIYTSPAYEELWGFDHNMADRLDEFYKIILPQDLHILQSAIEKQRLGEKTEVEYRIRHPDGSVRWIWERAFPFLDENGKTTRVAGVATDITERKQAEQKILELNAELEQRVESRTIDLQASEEKARLLASELEAVRQATISLTSQLELSAVLDAILKSTINLLPNIENMHLYLVRNDQLEFATALWGGGRKSSPINPHRPGGLTDSVLQQGEIILVEDMQHHPLYEGAPDDWSGAMIGMPLKFGTQLIGVMNVHYEEPRSFSKSEIRLLQLFADQAAIAVEKARLFQDLQDEKDRLEQHTRQREIMSAMTDLLQASLTTEEAGKIVSSHIKVLFPNLAGALYLTNSTNSFEPIAIWGDQNYLDVLYTTDDCWALRRGKPYRFGSGLPNPPCAHVGKVIPQHALCIPLSAQGENIGNLHMSTQNRGSEIIREDEQRFIETIADSISLALANLRLRERLHFESIRDGLTGLFNRRYLDETLPREIHQAERKNQPISVFMFDIDHFKKFNDTYGHDAGDVVLKSIAGLILSGIREGDIGCRYGGEEFVVILPDTTLDVASRRAEDLRKEASQLMLRHHGQDLGKVTISIGVASYPEHGATRDTLIKSADEASYQAKEGGRNRVIVCKKE